MRSKLIFRKEKCIAELRAKGLFEESRPWMDACDGKEVILNAGDSGYVVGTPFRAFISWCEEVPVSE